MTNTVAFRKAFTERLIALSAEANGVPTYESGRRYQTDAVFHAQIEILVGLAVDALMAIDSPDVPDELGEIFKGEVNDLLKWDH